MHEIEARTSVARGLEAQLNQLKLDVFPLLLNQAKKSAQRSIHESRSMAVLFLDLQGFSRMNTDDANAALQALRSHVSGLMRRFEADYPNTWGDAVVVAFEDPNEALKFACLLVQFLTVEGVGTRVGMSYGLLGVAFNEVREALDIAGEAVNEAARLEPLAAVGEVLIADTLRYHPALQKEKFQFLMTQRRLTKGFGQFDAGEQLTCYLVKLTRPG